MNDSIGNQSEYDKHHAMVLDRLAKIKGDETKDCAVVIFIDRDKQELFTHGINLTSDEVTAVLAIATADIQGELDRIKAQVEKELTNPQQH